MLALANPWTPAKNIVCDRMAFINVGLPWSSKPDSTHRYVGWRAISCIYHWKKRWHRASTSDAVLAEIPLRSPQKLFVFIVKKTFVGSKYPKIKLFNFEKNFTAYLVEAGLAGGEVFAESLFIAEGCVGPV